MAKIIDITNKLNFEDKPIIKVKDIEIEVNNSATTMLKILPLLKEDVTAEQIKDICDLIFDGENRDKIYALNLSIADFSTVVMAAVDLVADTSGNDEGETPTPATT